MVPPRDSISEVRWNFENDACLCPCDYKVSLSSRWFLIRKWVSFTYGLRALKTGVFALDLRVMSLWMSSLRAGSLSHIVLWFSYVIFIGFQSQMFWEFISLVQDLRLGVPDVKHKPLIHQGNVLCLWDTA